MKKTKLTGVMAIARVLRITFSGVAATSRTACSTPGTETVNTVIEIACRGMMTENGGVNWESSNEDLLSSPPLQDREVIGEMDYKQDLKVTDGQTRFAKDTGVDTGDTLNLDMMRSVGYNQADTIGSLSLDEDVGMSIVSNWANTSEVVTDSFATRATNNKLLARCEDVKASSSMVVTDVLATTRSKVGITEAPVNLHYEVTATGSGVLPEKDSDGTPLAHGRIAAEFSAFAPGRSAETGEHCGCGNVSKPTLGSRLTYHERRTANGLWHSSTWRWITRQRLNPDIAKAKSE